jgi:carboxyl-terminal processing protease
MSSKKLQIWLPALFSLVMVLGMFIGYNLREHSGNVSFLNSGKKNSVQEVLDLIRSKYVDPIKVDSIGEIAIEELLTHLDPHTLYIPPVHLKEVNEDLMGNFQGIGVEFQLFDDTINIINVIKNGPSEKAGVLVGDKIIKVNDTIKVAGAKIGTDDIRKYLRGEENSKVNITVLRGTSTKKIEITRGNIPVSTIDAAYIIEPTVGFIRINKFGEKTYEEFMENLERLQKEKMQSLILDLRGNGGGLMNEAVDIADEFLSDDKLIVYTEGNKSPRFEYRCKRDGLFEKGKLMILVDETSASASEVLAGALQDWDRATIIGRRTFGKGLVQQQFGLSNGGALRLTISRYYSPLGRNIQKPYSNKSRKEYEEELLERYNDGELVKGDSLKNAGTSFKTPAGRTVYGGGGITPDIFVSADTNFMTKEVNTLFRKNTMSKFVYNYFIENRSYFNEIKTPKDAVNQFVVNENDWSKLVIFAAKDSVQLNNIATVSRTYIMQQFKSLLIKQLFRNQGYFEAMNITDSVVQKAIIELKK